ncbi:hypothetical protein HNP37_002687 [Flavobacterium nitrogenifigens]|uniref:Uncharacterized protein n=2 Tax=Flavobacterium TaxID=237 RepID=A0A7W7IY22_9FLAO|nr:hypothetical protein [Flavobacterium nitrogenifigens]
MKSALLKRKVASLIKQLFGILVLTFLFFACSSDDGGSDKTSDYYFKASLDGKKINFYNVNFQGGGNDNRFEHIVVAGFEAPYPTKIGEQLPPSLDFEIWRTGGDIKAGTYTTPQEPEMIARYAVQTANGTVVYNTSAADDIFTVKIESISKNGIKGTFSGKVRNLDSGKAIEIKEGTFNLPYEEIVNP